MAYYLYLYGFTYLNQNSSSTFLFNVYNKKKLLSNHPVVYKVLYKINRTKLTYKGCFLSEREYQNPIVKSLIRNIVEYSFGGFIITEKDKSPIQFPSEIYIQRFNRNDNQLSKKFENKDLNKYRGKN